MVTAPALVMRDADRLTRADLREYLLTDAKNIFRAILRVLSFFALVKRYLKAT